MLNRLRLPVLAWLACLVAASAADERPAIEFNRDVRPILADHCFQCHGPDARQRKADLRLDTADAASPSREGGPVVVAGSLEKSELWRRINSADPDERMPPPDKGGKLSAAEIATLREWIASGAKFEKHWSLLPVRRPKVPVNPASGGRQAPGSIDPAKGPDDRETDASRSPLSPLDTFVLARLEKESLAPSPPADRPTLLRRVTLGLTGLPPTPDEIDAFLTDKSPDAYERVIDRLLASPRYGERMAVPWLDAARYADTSGYQSDGERFMWRWRDWVIEALNANMPFDQFTIEQLAGDLLPSPTLDQRIATGFNRNHRGNAEGGIIPEEYAVEYVADRVETTATVWLGLTLGCARCHDHKYDPFTQLDFYSLFAFFNNVPEKGRAIKFGNSPPFIQAPTRLQLEERARLREELIRVNEECQKLQTELTTGRFEWEAGAAGKKLGDWYPSEFLAAHFPLDGNTIERTTGRAAKAAEADCRFREGRLALSGQFDGKSSLELEGLGDFGFYDRFSLAAWVLVDDRDNGGTIVSRMADAPEGEGYQLALAGGKLQLNLVKRWLDDSLRVETAEPLTSGVWHHVAATYDGSRVAAGVNLYVDGEWQRPVVLLDELNQSFASKEPLRIGGGGGLQHRFRGSIDDVRVYASVLSWDEVAILATPQTLDQIVAIAADKRTLGQRAKIEAYYLEREAPAELRKANRYFDLAVRRMADFVRQLPTVMVMKELPTPRETHILIRGQYDKPGERVEPNVPVELPPMPADAPRNRLGLARWLVDPANPLTSRVFVNRVWQLHFGTGIVKTAEDFGRQGEWPSHPELLDWLAAEFISDWDVKRLHRVIVTSATYRQVSQFKVQSAKFKVSGTNATLNLEPGNLNSALADSANRLLSRGPRLRLSAEMVRDQALFASGLLVEQLGGPSVKPLQPAGLWSELTGGEDYQPGSGADLIRRSLYTFWKRTIPPPTLATFDAPSREACTVLPSRTNTPLQALALLNEPTFVAAAKALAERIMREAAMPSERIERAMLLVIGRSPTEGERAILVAALARYQERYANADELTAYALLCSTILNLDEAVTSQ